MRSFPPTDTTTDGSPVTVLPENTTYLSVSPNYAGRYVGDEFEFSDRNHGVLPGDILLPGCVCLPGAQSTHTR